MTTATASAPAAPAEFSSKITNHATGCPACSAKRVHTHVRHFDVYQCVKCEAIFGRLYLGDSYSLVKPFFSKDQGADKRARYFDFETLGSAGVGRRHGWYDPETRLTTHTG